MSVPRVEPDRAPPLVYRATFPNRHGELWVYEMDLKSGSECLYGDETDWREEDHARLVFSDLERAWLGVVRATAQMGHQDFLAVRIPA
jgi:hypothetical protein